MKLVSVLLGQTVQLMTTSVPSGSFYMPEAVSALKKRYGFVDTPTTLQDYDPNKGIAFRHGKFPITRSAILGESAPREILIDLFQVFGNGFRVDTRVYIEYVDTFVEDVLKWAAESFGLKILQEHPVLSFYLSQVEVKSDIALGTLFNMFNPLAEITKDLFRKYGYESHGLVYPPFEVSGLVLNTDLTQVRFPLLSPLTFERRVQQPYTSNLYYSTAPLKTLDHLEVLEELEKTATRLVPKG